MTTVRLAADLWRAWLIWACEAAGGRGCAMRPAAVGAVASRGRAGRRRRTVQTYDVLVPPFLAGD
ncbi:MAG: hypothetical protein ACF8R7_02520 [Phycisphaerales bacterium JB039]